MNANPCVSPQLFLQNRVNGRHSGWGSDDVHIIQVRENEFTFLQFCLGSSQSVVLAQGEEHGHQWVALLATFFLIHVTDFACVVLLQIAGWAFVELMNEWNC